LRFNGEIEMSAKERTRKSRSRGTLSTARLRYHGWLAAALHRGSRLARILRPDVPLSRDPAYQLWLIDHAPTRTRLRQMRRQSQSLAAQPLFSVIMPVFDPPVRYLREAVESVRAQAYPRWELLIVDDGSSDPAVVALLGDAASTDARITVQALGRNAGISAASNVAIERASGDYLVLLDHDDLLTPHALYELAWAVNEHPDADMIYSDEDKVDEHGILSGPFFKPDWCPDSFLSRMYVCHLTVLRRTLVEALGRFRTELEGGHLYDLVLRLTERSDRVLHIPEVLYHWRMHPASTALDSAVKPWVYEADHRALQLAIDRRSEPGQVVPVTGFPGFYIVRYQIRKYEKVSIIIPTRDHAELLDKCLASIAAKSTYPDFEIILIDNGSVEPVTTQLIADWTAREPERLRSIRLDIPFNFSRLCNHGVSQAQGSYLLFLNDDTEVITPDWIDAMVEQAQRPAIGAVGALLLYADGSIQHAGAILGLGGLAAHSHRGCSSESPGYAGQVISINNYLSVAGACLMCRRTVFEEVGPFLEDLPSGYEDVDLCLKMVEQGYRNVWLPHVRLFHYEGQSRGRDYPLKEPVEYQRSVDYMVGRWRKFIDEDPCYNPNLTRAFEDYRLAIDVERAGNPQTAPYDSLSSGGLKNFHCVVDELKMTDGRFLIRGWAMGKKGETLKCLEVGIDGLEIGCATLGVPRQDVYACHPSLGNRESGYLFYQAVQSPIGRASTLTLRMKKQDGTVETARLRLPRWLTDAAAGDAREIRA
jgi:glycosyltransferase involved in cell wall biosynthesis